MGRRTRGQKTESMFLKAEYSLETFIGFCLPSEGEKVGQHTQRTVTGNSGSERESFAEPCQDETVRVTPFILGHLAEVTWLWEKLRPVDPLVCVPCRPWELGARGGSHFKTNM